MTPLTRAQYALALMAALAGNYVVAVTLVILACLLEIWEEAS